mgnify:FL=1
MSVEETSFNCFFRAKKLITVNKNLSGDLFFQALELSKKEKNIDIELLSTSNLILFSSELNLDISKIETFIIKGTERFGLSLYFWYCLGSHYLKIKSFHQAIKAFETAYKIHDKDLLFDFISSQTGFFKSVNILVKESQEKGFYFQKILKGLKNAMLAINISKN